MEGENENKKGLWTKEEDRVLLDYIRVHGRGRWNRIPKVTGLKRSGKSCRLRWLNYLSPNVKRGDFSEQEEDLIIRLHNLLGNRWSLIARRVPGRTDNQVKNYWNSHLCKKLGIQKQTRKLLVSPKSSDDHSASVEEGEKLLPAVPDSNSKQSYCSRSTSTSSSVKDMELESMKNDENSRLDVGDEEIEWMTKHCAESPFCSNYDSLISWGVVEFLQGYPLDLL